MHVAMRQRGRTEQFEGVPSHHSVWAWVLFYKVQVLEQQCTAIQVVLAASRLQPLRREQSWILQQAFC